MSNPSLPKKLFGYEVIDRIGEGALSSIYVVSDPKTRQLFALKHVVPKEEKHARFIEQLETEYKVSRTFRHPGLRKTLDLKIKKRFFSSTVAEAALIMELFDGVPLDQALPKTVPEIVDIFVKVAVALGALHHYQYLHCDTKPNNILRDRANNVKLIDFGQACMAGTIKQRIQGTPDYIAPEQARCRQLGYYTDIYNFGATLYWALAGRRVPTLLTVEKSERAVIKEQTYPAPKDLNAEVPAALSDLVMDCLQYSPAYRPQTMDEVLQRLRPHAHAAASPTPT